MGYDHYKVATFLPEGQDGCWRVERFEVSKEDERFERVRAIASSSDRGRFVPAGQYTRLMRGPVGVMSDTPDEVRDHYPLIYRARGRILIHGLGLGMAAHACLLNDRVEHVDIVELAPEVIRLVGPHLTRLFGARVEIIEANALTWKPPKGARWDVCWHDIWDDACADNLPEMRGLHRRFGGRCAWQGSWLRDLCEEQARADRRYGG